MPHDKISAKVAAGLWSVVTSLPHSLPLRMHMIAHKFEGVLEAEDSDSEDGEPLAT